MENISENPEHNIQLILSLLYAKNVKKNASIDEVCEPKKRQRLKKCWLRTLIALWKFEFFSKKNGWKDSFPSIDTISKWAGCSPDEVSRFINSNVFEIFATVWRRNFKSNHYTILEPFSQIFLLFKKKGLFNGFDKNPKRWLSMFLKKVESWIMPIAQTCKSVYELMNKLSTKNNLKSGAKSFLKAVRSLPSEFFSNSSSKEEYEDETEDPLKAKGDSILGILRDRLLLREGDVNHFFLKESLSIVQKASNILLYRIEVLKWEPKSRVRALQKIINELKKAS